MKTTRAWWVVAILVGCGGGGSSGGPFDSIDARCTALCMSSEPTCAADVTDCEQLCQLRVADVQSLCTTCLLDHANGGTCSSGAVCCPRAHFPNGVEDCKTECTGSTGVNPTEHPVCADICASSEPSCTAQAQSCLDQCEARVHGVSGLCALCLLEGANGGTCASGSICCPSPHFPNGTADCTDACM